VTLTEFLLARIAEDEANLPDGFDCWYKPERYATECVVKRRIVEWAIGWLENDYAPQNETLLKLLALPYDDHPDFRLVWYP